MDRRAVAIGVCGAALALACGGRGAPERAGARGSERTIEGRVLRSDGGRLVVRPPGAEALPLRVPEAAEVTVGGVGLSAAHVRPGAEVRARYEVRGDEAVAIAVDVVKPGGAYMTRGSEWHPGLAPEEGGAAPSQPAGGGEEDRRGGSAAGPASQATAPGGGAHGGQGGGLYGPDRGDTPARAPRQ